MSWDKMTAALLAVIAISLPAVAADKGGDRPSFLPVGEVVDKATTWTGVYASVGAGVQIADTELSTEGAFLDGISGDGWAGDGRIGLDWQPKGSAIVLGVLGGYNLGEAKAEAGAFGGTVSATLTPTWYLGGRVGLALPTSTLVYGGAAWQEAKGELGGSWSGSQTEQGIMYIAGIEQLVAPTLTLGAEYSLSQYEFEPVEGLSVDPDVHAFKARLTWRPLSK